jgi:hypothetical protein
MLDINPFSDESLAMIFSPIFVGCQVTLSVSFDVKIF